LPQPGCKKPTLVRSGGAGEQGGFKEVFLSFITGGAPPVRLLSINTGSQESGVERCFFHS